MKVIIDSKEYECQPDQNLLDVARQNGIDIPTLCFNPLTTELRHAGCRLCVVEVKAGGRPGLGSSCTMPVAEGLTISTTSEAVYNERRLVLELLLSEHVQDCQNCPMSGDCIFAKLCRDYDVDGVSVCAECPNQKEGCLLKRHVLCLGPITYANCDAYCTRAGYRCEGCHSVLGKDEVIRFGLKAYADAGFAKNEILQAAKVYSYDAMNRLARIMKEEGFE